MFVYVSICGRTDKKRQSAYDMHDTTSSLFTFSKSLAGGVQDLSRHPSAVALRISKIKSADSPELSPHGRAQVTRGKFFIRVLVNFIAMIFSSSY